MATTSDIRRGMCIEMNNDTYAIVEFQHVKPGKGAAFVYVKLKSLTNGRVIEQNIPAGHKVDDVRIERRNYQYLYNDEAGYHFMDNDTYDQVTLQEDMLERPGLLKEGTQVEVVFHAVKEIPLTVNMPQYVILEVTYSEPGLRGDTATNTLKPAKVETGADVRVPLFVEVGDLIKIDTEAGAYMERVKQ
ncbi:MAG: elongation factor P [Saprospiraceae bacterium]|nr:elongation factor P [Saprospiraceae bacterium]